MHEWHVHFPTWDGSSWILCSCIYQKLIIILICGFYANLCVCVCVLGIYLMSFNLTSNSLHLGVIFVTIRNNNTCKYLESRFATHIPRESHVHIFLSPPQIPLWKFHHTWLVLIWFYKLRFSTSLRIIAHCVRSIGWYSWPPLLM
jgi:hypothetical protein